MKPLIIPCSCLLIILPAAALAGDDPWTVYCSYPTPENAAKVQSAKSPGIDDREFDARLQILEDQVLCGDVEAVRLVYRLKKEADGAYSEVLSVMLGRLIRINPRLFLGELARHRQQVGDRLPWILCSTGPTYVDRVAAKRYVLRRRVASIKTVDDPSLLALRDECTAQLQRSIEELGKIQPHGAHSGPGDPERAVPTWQLPIHRVEWSDQPTPIKKSHEHLPPGDWGREVIEPRPVDRRRPGSSLLQELER